MLAGLTPRAQSSGRGSAKNAENAKNPKTAWIQWVGGASARLQKIARNAEIRRQDDCSACILDQTRRGRCAPALSAEGNGSDTHLPAARAVIDDGTGGNIAGGSLLPEMSLQRIAGWCCVIQPAEARTFHSRGAIPIPEAAAGSISTSIRKINRRRSNVSSPWARDGIPGDILQERITWCSRIQAAPCSVSCKRRMRQPHEAFAAVEGRQKQSVTAPDPSSSSAAPARARRRSTG